MSIKSEIETALGKMRRDLVVDDHTIERGQIVKTTKRTFFEGSFSRRNMLDRIARINGPAGSAEISMAQLELFLLRIRDDIKGNHRHVLHDQSWQTFYHMSAHPVQWQCIDQQGQPQPFIYQRSIPCWHCGIVLPIQAMQIDHSRPIEGNNTEAVAKFFRHAGATRAAAKGMKGRQNTIWAASEGTMDDRYSLSDTGIILFQLIRSAGVYKKFEKSCLDSYENLRPLCAQCNTRRNSQPLSKF